MRGNDFKGFAPRKIFIGKGFFQIDHEGLLAIHDGYAEIGLAPDEVEALRQFLTPEAPSQGQGREP